MNPFEKGLAALGALAAAANPAIADTTGTGRADSTRIDIESVQGSSAVEKETAAAFQPHAEALFTDFKARHPGLVPDGCTVRAVFRNEYEPRDGQLMEDPAHVLAILVEDSAGKSIGTVVMEGVVSDDPALLGSGTLALAHVRSRLGSAFDAGMLAMLRKDQETGGQ